MNVRVLKINETVFVGEALSVDVPGITGDMQILPGHESLATVLRIGAIVITDTEKQKHEVEIEHGYLEVTPNQVTIIL